MPKYYSKDKNRTVQYEGPEYGEDGTNIPMSKGYRKILTVVKDGQEKEITDDLLDAATTKGYKIKELADAEEQKTFSPVEAGARGFVQGATLGLSDEAKGLAAGTKALFSGKKVGEEYDRARDEERQLNKMASEESPVEYTVGEVGGGILSPSPIKGGGLAKTAAKGAIEGGVAGFGMGEGDISEQAKSTVTGAGLGGTIGAAAKGVEAVGGKLISAADEAVGSMRGGKAAQFVEEPSKFREAAEAPQRIAEKKREFGEMSVGAKRQIKGDLQLAERKSARKYEVLKDALSKFDKPVDEANDATTMARTILADSKKNAFIDDESRRLIDLVEREAKTSTGKPMMIPEIDPQSGRQIGFTRNPGLTEGESVELIVDMRQRLGEIIEWGPNVGMSKTERLANKQLKDSYYKLDNYTKQLGENMDPELRKVYEDANKSYSRYIRSKAGIEKYAGTVKNPDGGKRGVSEKRLRSNIERGAEDDQAALKAAVEGVSPAGAQNISQMAENVESRDALKRLVEDRQVLNKGGLAVPVPKLGYVGVTPLTAARGYTVVRDVFAKPALTAAVRTLETTNRPITIETVRALSQQHGVNEGELAETLRQSGALKE